MIDLRTFPRNHMKTYKIGPRYYSWETQRHREIIKQLKQASDLNTAILSPKTGGNV